MLRLIRRDVIVLSLDDFLFFFSFIPYSTYFLRLKRHCIVTSDMTYSWRSICLRFEFVIRYDRDANEVGYRQKEKKNRNFSNENSHIDIQDKPTINDIDLYYFNCVKYRYLYTYIPTYLCIYPNVVRCSEVEILKVFVLNLETIAYAHEFHKDFVKRHWKITLAKFSYSQWLWRRWWQQL